MAVLEILHVFYDLRPKMHQIPKKKTTNYIYCIIVII